MSELERIISAGPRTGQVSAIVDAVAALYRVSAADIMGRSKARSIAEARVCAYYIARHCTRMSFPELGRAFGNRDHTTVLDGVRRAEQLCASDRWVARAIAALFDEFGEMREEERMQ